jgi:uncharacterized lipoprotein YddW (UPF0748 family)
MDMSFQKFCAIMQFIALAPAAAVASTTGTLEPGQAQATTTLKAVSDVPTTWTSPAREARAIWVTGAEMLQPREEVLSRLDALADAHFNAVLLDTWFRGFVIYPGNDHVPQYPPAVKVGDILSWLVPEAKKRGLQVHAWPEYGFYAYHTLDAKTDSSRGPLLDKHPHLMAVAADGTSVLHNPQFGDYYSLCPANPKSHRLLADIYVDTMTRYEFDGINLDRLRFASASYCHCKHCKEKFKKDTGTELQAFDEGTTGAEKFLQWKREQLADGVETIVKAVREARPDADITAYVVGPDEMDEKAQSWDLWVKRDLLDVIAVSMYGPDIREAADKATKLLGNKSNILAAAINAGFPDSSFLLRNIGFARKLAPVGQFVWYFADVMDDLDELKSGPYESKAEWPLE